MAFEDYQLHCNLQGSIAVNLIMHCNKRVDSTCGSFDANMASFKGGCECNIATQLSMFKCLV